MLNPNNYKNQNGLIFKFFAKKCTEYAKVTLTPSIHTFLYSASEMFNRF